MKSGKSFASEVNLGDWNAFRTALPKWANSPLDDGGLGRGNEITLVDGAENPKGFSDDSFEENRVDACVSTGSAYDSMGGDRLGVSMDVVNASGSASKLKSSRFVDEFVEESDAIS